MIMSPLSIQTLMALVAAGSRGQTFEELTLGLNLPSNDTTVVAADFQTMLAPLQHNPIIQMANAIYVASQYNIQPQFCAIAKNSYYSKVQSLDYTNAAAAASTINTWVSNKTNDKINNLIDPSYLTPDTEIVLVNAVYFNGLWEHPFNHRMLPQTPFFNSKNCSEVAGYVNMMSVKVNKILISSIYPKQHKDLVVV